MKKFFKNLSFRDIFPLLLLLILVAAGVVGCIYLTPMIGSIDWSGVYGNG